MAKSRRRFLPFVHFKFQIKYTSVMILLVLITTVAFSVYLLQIHQEMISILAIDSEIAEELARDSRLKAGFAILVLFLVESILLFIIGIRMTNRLIGPVDKMKRHMEVMNKNQWPEMVPLRAGDEFQDAYGELCLLTNSLRSQQQQQKKLLEQCISDKNCTAEIKLSLQKLL